MLRCPLYFWIGSLLALFAGSAIAQEGIDLEKGREFWAFKRPLKSDPPTVQARGWPRSPIDHFILAKLESDKHPAPRDLEKLKLVRRAYFDLHGLPPTPEQIDAFVPDTSPGAFERLVDRLLASPHFGERWERHWLDVVRFAESTGGGRTMLLEHSWRYRDYVIEPELPGDQSGRLELAEWLVADDHPLTARVMANRIWKHLMGAGLVRTPDNFGSTGELPTHPELLDWLALRLIENGWSIKQTVREIMLTRIYQSARPNPRRLDAESLRDAILLASGQLDTTMGGATIKPGTKSEFGYKFDSNRRSVYLPVFRNALPDLFAVFDFPDPNLVAGKRNTSTLATQALYFMNHPFVIDQSKRAAEALVKSGMPTRQSE